MLDNLNDFVDFKFSTYFDDKYYFYDMLSGNILWYDCRNDGFNVIIDNYAYYEKDNSYLEPLSISNTLYMELLYIIENINIQMCNITINGKDYMLDNLSKQYLTTRYATTEIKDMISLKELLINSVIIRHYNRSLDIFKDVIQHHDLNEIEMNCFDYINNLNNRTEIDKIITKIQIIGKNNLHKHELLFLDKLEKM
jgi:hypothetical protein